jgi:AmmeMemoRadiSam system radical SAM enzyme
MSSLANVLDSLTVEGELYEKLEDNSLRCFACGHRCLIREGRRGICQVRFNKGGKLFVPHGYVAALQSDPIEKKPFSHVLPGTNALTFGMLGCDYHCPYCFTGDTLVATNLGPKTLEECFLVSEHIETHPDGEIGYPSSLKAFSASGNKRKVRAVFKHPYRGELFVIQPYYLPELRCTPDHRIYAAADVSSQPELIHAKDLTQDRYLAIPRRYSFSAPQVIDTPQILAGHTTIYQTPWKLPSRDIAFILEESSRGKSSREIGLALGKHPSYIRHIRSKHQRGKLLHAREKGAVIEGNTIRFPNEHMPGIPTKIKADENAARLFGLYCAEGSVVKDKNRPNSFVVNFSFSPAEGSYAEETLQLLRMIFGASAQLVKRATTLGVSLNKASAGLLFKSLAGGRSSEKRVPEFIFASPKNIAQTFLDAYVDGDGHRYKNGKVSITTVSRDLAYGIAWLALELGHLPSVYDAEMPSKANIQGREVNRAPHQYTVVWYEGNSIRRKMIETHEFYLIPLKNIQTIPFDGYVFNMEVEEEHNYLANFFAVSNCQNWLTSQAMRDPTSDASAQFIRKMTPQKMVEYAQSTNASVVVSSYNEPLITSEWAVEIFKTAKANGLMCAYVSNGNNTPEVMDYIAPYLDAYKIDLKCMNDKNYRKLGGTLQHTLDGIKRAREAGLWVEVVTLVIPGFNDSNEELWDAARFLAEVSVDIPWHVTAFHKDYKMTEPDNTDAKTLIRAAEIGREAGLRFVYAGNLPGHVGEYEDTLCPQCSHRLVVRRGYVVKEYNVMGEGKCPKCGEKIAGLWHTDPSRVVLNGIGHPLPVR